MPYTHFHNWRIHTHRRRLRGGPHHREISRQQRPWRIGFAVLVLAGAVWWGVSEGALDPVVSMLPGEIPQFRNTGEAVAYLEVTLNRIRSKQEVMILKTMQDTLRSCINAQSEYKSQAINRLRNMERTMTMREWRDFEAMSRSDFTRQRLAAHVERHGYRAMATYLKAEEKAVDRVLQVCGLPRFIEMPEFMECRVGRRKWRPQPSGVRIAETLTPPGCCCLPRET